MSEATSGDSRSTPIPGTATTAGPTVASAGRPSSPQRTGRSQRRPRRWLPYFLGVLLLAVLILGFIPRPTAVETAAVRRGTLRVTVNEEGKTRVRQRFVVSAPVAGQLRRIEFKAGANVEAGRTVLAVIDPIAPALLDTRSRSLAEARRDTARANLEKAREALRFASVDLRRFEKLHREGTISPQELESFQWRESAAAKELAASESALRQAEAELDETNGAGASTNRAPIVVTSPTRGRVLRVLEENARVVTPGFPLLEVGDPTDLEVVIEVLSQDGAMITPGTKVELAQWGGTQPLAARVRLVEPAAFTKVSALGVEEQRVRVIADLLSPPDQRPGLGDAFRVDARILVWEAENTLQAPIGALFRLGTNWATYTVANGRARLQRLTVGRTSTTDAQIVEGLAEGDVVVLYPGDRVTEGLRVRAIEISP